MADDTGKQNMIEEVVEDLMEDPDAPEKGNTTPPQTIEGEPEGEKRP